MMIRARASAFSVFLFLKVHTLITTAAIHLKLAMIILLSTTLAENFKPRPLRLLA